MGYLIMSFACVVFIILLINVILILTNDLYVALYDIKPIATI